MRELIIKANPVMPVEIFEQTLNGLNKISQVQTPQDSIEFIKNYTEYTEGKMKVTFIGPKSYIQYFIDKANQIKSVTATAAED